MPFVENLAPFFDQFGDNATLNGAALKAIVDTETVTGFDTLVQGPTALVKSSDSPSATQGQAFVANGITYSVRQVLRQPPDGAFTRLILVKP